MILAVIELEWALQILRAVLAYSVSMEEAGFEA